MCMNIHVTQYVRACSQLFAVAAEVARVVLIYYTLNAEMV